MTMRSVKMNYGLRSVAALLLLYGPGSGQITGSVLENYWITMLALALISLWMPVPPRGLKPFLFAIAIVVFRVLPTLPSPIGGPAEALRVLALAIGIAGPPDETVHVPKRVAQCWQVLWNAGGSLLLLFALVAVLWRGIVGGLPI